MSEVDEDVPMEGLEEVALALAAALVQSRNSQHPNAEKGRRSNASRPKKKKDATKQESRSKLKAAIEELTRVVTS
jgi:hypothetical protein